MKDSTNEKIDHQNQNHLARSPLFSRDYCTVMTTVPKNQHYEYMTKVKIHCDKITLWPNYRFRSRFVPNYLLLHRLPKNQLLTVSYLVPSLLW